MHESSHRQNVIEKYLQGLHHDEEGYSHGYLKSDDELKLFETSLAAVYEKYAVRTSRGLNKSSKYTHLIEAPAPPKFRQMGGKSSRAAQLDIGTPRRF
ncbi:hypothetical protein HPB50_023950 [Hyalomma asiaticum]|uniref:Uncharacterized protein n=1 Tax=Hyalomma asiaticum TaxID=266040 RepID=A0ACB7S5C4_HYAAI|nr:hypothetical protein HPB50_023950 [Hyalomma asiaticum]